MPVILYQLYQRFKTLPLDYACERSRTTILFWFLRERVLDHPDRSWNLEEWEALFDKYSNVTEGMCRRYRFEMARDQRKISLLKESGCDWNECTTKQTLSDIMSGVRTRFELRITWQ